MKVSLRIVVSVAALTLCAAAFSPAFAKQGEKSVEISGDIATEPAGNVGATAGFTAGVGYEIMDDLQVRGDLSYYSWDGFERIPIVVGARKYFPTPFRELKAFGQGGLEVSFDNSDADDDTRVGVNLGGGVEYTIAPRFTIGSDLRFHVIKHWYTTIGFGLGYHF